MSRPRHDSQGARRPAAYAVGIAALFAGSLAGGAAAAEPDLGAWLEHDWYSVEVVLFRHRTVATDEELVRHAPRHYPLPLTGFARGPESDTDPDAAWLIGEAPGDAERPLPPAWLWMDAPADPAGDADSQGRAPPVPGNPLPVDPALPTSERGRTIPAPPPSPSSPASPESVARAAFAAFEGALAHSSMRWREDGLTLTGHVRRMRRSGAYDVLRHGRWQQPTVTPGSAVPLLVQLGPRRPDGLFEVEGTLRVSRARYIRVDAELWLHGAYASRSPNGTEGGYAVLSETRRMRARKVHYLDHPMLGLVIRVEPLEMPDALVELARIAEEGL